MAIQQLANASGFFAKRVSSMDGRALGKLTDSNHLGSLRSSEPADYDKKIISLYTQSQMYSNDFLDMVSKSTPFLIDGNTDSFKWKIAVPYQFPKITDIPASTSNLAQIGIDEHEFQFVLDTREFSKSAIIALGSKKYGPQVAIIKDPVPFGRGWLYTARLVTNNPKTDFISTQFLAVGNEVELVNNTVGEFDQDLLGLGKLGDEIELFETLSSGYGVQHTVTKWADQRTLRDNDGKALDLIVYGKYERGENGVSKPLGSVRWEPFIEYELRKKMLCLKVSRMIWSKAGTVRLEGTANDLNRVEAGIYHRIKSSGNYVPYNRGEFSTILLRRVFGDLFYRRVDVKDRRVKMFTNEAGFEVFQEAAKRDALNSGLTLMTNVDALSSGNVNMSSPQNHLTYSYTIDSIVSRETGRIELHHLKELDLPSTNLEFGQNIKSPAIFFVFDVSMTENQDLSSNVREVRLKGAPSMTWGYEDGRQHHLGFAASQGMSSANSFPGYKIWMEDRADIFIEDLSKAVLIEELPFI